MLRTSYLNIRTWLATVDDVKTVIMTSNGDIYIPELGFQSRFSF